MCLSSCAIRGTLGLVRLSRSIHLLADGGGAVVDEGGIDLRLGVRCSPDGGVRRVHAVLQVLVGCAPFARHVRLRWGQRFEAAPCLCPEFPELGVDVFRVDVFRVDVFRVRCITAGCDSGCCRDHVPRLEQALRGLAAKGSHAHRQHTIT